MTQDEIIEMARQVGLPHWYQTKEVVNIELLERFAKLVAQHAKAEEREACAKVCETYDQREMFNDEDMAVADSCAEAIRARGEASIRGQA
jgi:DNA repair photolyase